MAKDFKVAPTYEGKKVLHDKLLSAKGDLFVAIASQTSAVLPVGGDGAVLEADSTTASGLKWNVPTDVLPFASSGPLYVRTGQGRFYFPFNATILAVSASVGTAPTGSAVIIDVNKNGTTIYSTQSSRPTISAAANYSAEVAPNITGIIAGDYLTIDIDQVGSTIAGSDLTVVIRYRRA